MTFSNPVVGGEGGELIRDSIKSTNFVTTVSGWIIRRDGSAEFSDIVIRGGAIVGGSITIGPDGMPQVIIDSNASEGFIEFPTNAASEVTPAIIVSDVVNAGAANERVRLNINGGETGTAGQLFIGLLSAADDGSSGPLMSLIAGDGGATITDEGITVDGEVEIIGTLSSSSNFPARVVGGKVRGSTTNTTLAATDTEVVDAETSVSLENGVAYRVDVQVVTDASAGTSAAGTQAIFWKIWDGAVGGTQLGPSIQRVTDSVGGIDSPVQVSFLFEYTGTSGAKTVRLSGRQSVGTDTLRAIVNTQYFMVVNRIGNPAKITNL